LFGGSSILKLNRLAILIGNPKSIVENLKRIFLDKKGVRNREKLQTWSEWLRIGGENLRLRRNLGSS